MPGRSIKKLSLLVFLLQSLYSIGQTKMQQQINAAISIGEENGIERIEYWDSLLTLSKKFHFTQQEAIILNNSGMIYAFAGNNLKAEESFALSEKLYLQLKDESGLANVYSSVAYMHDQNGNIKKALDYYYRSLALAEKGKDTTLEMELYNNIGLVFQNQNDLQKAELFLKKAYDKSVQLNDQKKIAYCLNNIGTLYYLQGKVDTAILLIEQAKEIRKRIQDLSNMAESLNNLGTIYRDMNNLVAAKKCLLEASEIHVKLNSIDGLAYTHINLSRLYLKEKKFNEAMASAKSALTHSYELHNPEYIASSAEAIHDVAVLLNDFKLALEMKELYVKMHDSISNQENTKAVMKNQLKYEYEKKAAADSVKTSEEKKVVQAQLKQEQTQRYSLYGGLALVLFFALFMVNRFRVTNKQKKLIEEQKKIVEMQKHLVEMKQSEVLDSIRYAKRIQKALITSEFYIEKALKKLNNKKTF